ncbi:GNAT family N-acetyltransferase [Hyphococcus flavus]|uniref:GNAT family N-acetyltransferase n=1 Tax=Hyphococcus flavus TaxID=1866326 RepID=A0AAE9ZAS5_9PROT|nr:GNAT family N-acetyltransferase [Hyphococcus flavus]WDI30939.1 GNAT family N-acetyltransferase [Hyphococcus flavus]
MTLTVTEQTDDDWPDVWRILEPVVRAGDSYPLPLDYTEEQTRSFWIKTDGYNAVARDEDGTIIGVYYIKPDQGGPGNHICNAGYAIAVKARGKGYAVELCVQSQEQARAQGYKGMKYNLVVSTNTGAIKAWEKAGLQIIGTVPGAFRHPDQGFVDAYIMYRSLIADK